MWNWDEAKRAANLAKHGVDFAESASFDWSTAKTEPDLRWDYGEERLESVGLIGNRLFVLIYTMRGPRKRLISLRKANSRELEKWLT